MNVEYLDAPDGIDATWYVAHDTLYIALARDLDDVTRRRYIAQAKAEHGIKPTRRRLVIPFLLPAHGIHHASPVRKATVAGAGVVAAAGITAAVLLPSALDGNTNSIQRQPPAAAPAPSRTPPEHTTHAPATPSHPAATPRAPSGTPSPGRALPIQPHATGHKNPRVKPPVAVPVTPPVVEDPPVTEIPTPAPPAHRPLLSRVCITVDLITHVRIGCGEALGPSRP